jgi:hypothetical protein
VAGAPSRRARTFSSNRAISELRALCTMSPARDSRLD